jgi:tRNA uridine 5-carboxymethylaminomethyl modification enzyme
MSYYDVVVVGGGHAGVEAANIVGKMGHSAILITGHLDLIGQMSCNPAIGGIAKGNIVREIDALGGLMAKAIDRAGIHWRMLNKSKGKAVWGNRAQADKALYRVWCRKLLEQNKNLILYQGMAEKIITDDRGACGVELQSGERIHAKAVILTMGTFLNGVAHIGMKTIACGRSGEPPSLKLSESIQQCGIRAGRLKTGTPARIDGRSVNFEKLSPQKGDEEPWPFSFSSNAVPQNKASCWITKTTKETHDIIRDNLHQSALYGGKITGIGPRYCPSIEDKVVRFGDRDGHTLFLEPEGLDHQEMYCNGLSNSLPFDVQIALVRSVPGLEQARITRPAYAIEYDFFPPVQLLPTLESRNVANLYLAGQINGTSGYEEAACQGLVAGINAAEKIKGNEPFILGRDSSYTAVLIDDLVTKGTQEPYRMFTSRAEYRLLLRQDNADQRLMPIACEKGLIDAHIFEQRKKVWSAAEAIAQRLKACKIECREGNDKKRGIKKIAAAEYLKRPEISVEDVFNLCGIAESDREIKLRVEADVKYEGFVAKQLVEIERAKKMENTTIPKDFDYCGIPGLLSESKKKLDSIRPHTLGQASRISGVTPSDISILIVYLSRRNYE